MVRASREAAWAFWSNVANWAEVDPAVEWARIEGGFTAGARGETKPIGAPANAWQVIEVEAERGGLIELRVVELIGCKDKSASNRRANLAEEINRCQMKGNCRSMNYQIVTKTVRPQPLAAVRRRGLSRDIGRVWKPALDLVWEFLRRHEGLRAGGHNCFLYHQPAQRDTPMEIDFGVQVIGPFEGEGEVISTETPAGEVVMTTHVGSYDKLAGAHDAIHSWRAANGRAFGGCSWEIYGDWTDDPTKLETQVVYLLS